MSTFILKNEKKINETIKFSALIFINMKNINKITTGKKQQQNMKT